MDHEISRKNCSTILRIVANLGNIKVSELLGKGEATISKMCSRIGEKGNPDIKLSFPAIADVITAGGYKIVPIGWKCVDPETFKMLHRGHQLWSESMRNPDQLLFEDLE
jgi:hypothetical protein